MSDTHHDVVRDAFDNVATGYDALRRKLVPRLDDYYGAGLLLLAEAMAERPFRCLDLGIGTGLLAEMILERFPAAHVLGLDIAQKMLDGACTRLARFGDRIELDVANYADVALPGPVDAVVSALSIHHLDADQKRRLFQGVYDALAPGGVFINVDQSLAPTAEIEVAYQQRWIADIRAAGVSEEEVQAAIGRAALDRSSRLSEQVDWLIDAGFNTVDVPWKRHRFTVFYARKGG